MEKTIKKEVIKEKEFEFKRASELSKEEILELPKISVLVTSKNYLTKKMDKFGKETDIIESISIRNIVLSLNLNPYLKLTLSRGNDYYSKIKPVTESELILIKEIRNINIEIEKFTMSCRYRLIKGHRKDGSMWYRIQLFLGAGIVKSIFFTTVDLKLAKIKNLKLDFIESPELEEDIFSDNDSLEYYEI